MRVLRLIALALPLAGASAIASARAPAGEQVRIEADEIGIMKQEKLDAIAVEVTKLAEKEGIRPDQMSVSLVWEDRSAIVYGIRVRIVTDAAKVVDPADERGPIVQRCSDCSADDLVTASVEGVLEALQRYRAAKEPEPKVAEAEPPPEPEITPPAENATVDRPRGLAVMGQLGVAAIVVGASAVVTGGVLIGVDATRPAADPTQLREFRPTGYAVLGVGAAVLVTGVVLLAVDRMEANRRTAMAPVLAPGFVGVAVGTRF